MRGNPVRRARRARDRWVLAIDLAAYAALLWLAFIAAVAYNSAAPR